MGQWQRISVVGQSNGDLHGNVRTSIDRRLADVTMGQTNGRNVVAVRKLLAGAPRSVVERIAAHRRAAFDPEWAAKRDQRRARMARKKRRGWA